ncbi:MAG: cupin domain-containing protein, partial [Negativicutes bacterium]|nr:cupin domain-containing protein [Negativicutes bacterium]
HEQLGYIVQGSFELTLDGQKKTIRQGDSYHAPKNAVHGVVALENDSVFIDAFTPLRTDLLE